MTSSCATTTPGETESTTEIPGYDVITDATDDKVLPTTANDVTESSKAKEIGKSPTDVQPPTLPNTTNDLRLPARDKEKRPSFSLTPEKLWRQPPGFRGHENYGFEMAKWAERQQQDS